jgi:hypothetical protein
MEEDPQGLTQFLDFITNLCWFSLIVVGVDFFIFGSHHEDDHGDKRK